MGGGGKAKAKVKICFATPILFWQETLLLPCPSVAALAALGSQVTLTCRENILAAPMHTRHVSNFGANIKNRSDITDITNNESLQRNDTHIDAHPLFFTAGKRFNPVMQLCHVQPSLLTLNS